MQAVAAGGALSRALEEGSVAAPVAAAARQLAAFGAKGLRNDNKMAFSQFSNRLRALQL